MDNSVDLLVIRVGCPRSTAMRQSCQCKAAIGNSTTNSEESKTAKSQEGLGVQPGSFSVDLFWSAANEDSNSTQTKITAAKDRHRLARPESFTRTTSDSFFALHRGTLHRTVGTKDAAVAWFGTQQRLTANAFVEKLTGLGRHCFSFGEAANRAHQH